MSTGGPDLFVVCKSCGAEVSPYITECPYCGSRLRKRAPKLERGGKPAARPRRARPRVPALPRLRRGEIPGIRPDARPWVTIGLVGAGVVLSVLVRGGVVRLSKVAIVGPLDGEWWRLVTAPLTYANWGYAFAALLAIGVFGWLLERRHGPLAVGLLALVAGAGGMAVELATATIPLALGGNGIALALTAAWAVPDVRDLRRGREVEGDLLGVAVVLIVLMLLPVVDDEASAVAGVTGLLAGVVAGLGLSARRPA
ncbi:MAG: rhomboid family intramembrane serine protease [Solirubrobacteraceae bacterium]